MQKLTEIQARLKKFEKDYGITIGELQQGSEEWRLLKLGVLSASNASKIVAKVESETRATYMAGLVAQVCTGIMEELNFKQMEWGKLHEDPARSFYEFETGLTTTQLAFVYKDDAFREGCSPDGLAGDEKGFEIKCPYDSANYVKFLLDGSAKPEWRWQNQMTMRVMGCDQWDFVQYDPRMRKSLMTIYTIDRDEKMQKTLADAVPQFVSDMDKILTKIGIKFGDQWKASAFSKAVAS